MTLELPLRTTRLLLREFTRADLPALVGWSTDARVTRHLLYGPRDARAAARHLDTVIATQASQPRRNWELAITQAASPQPIGACDLTLNQPDELEVGYLLARAHWGCGYATEALRAIIDAGFSQLGITRIVATTAVENIRSAGVLERAGLCWEGLLRRHARGRGRVWDVNLYSIGREAWVPEIVE